MRILFVTYWHLPHVGGVWTYIQTLSAQLEKMGHEVEILAQHPDLSKYYLLQQGQMIEKSAFLPPVEEIVVSEYKKQQIETTPWLQSREIEKYTFEAICQRIDLDSYDLIHTQDILSTFACARVKSPFTPLIATIHGCLATEWIVGGEIQARTPLELEHITLEEKYGAMAADSLILPSKWLATHLSKFDVAHPRMQIIPYGLDISAFEKRGRLENVTDHQSKSKIIACPARLVAIKGQKYLLEAMKLVLEKGQDFVCWFIGDGVMRSELEQQRDYLGLQTYVQFLGDRLDVPQLLSQSDIVVLPSLQDNLPFAVMEAQTAGKPVIASKIGGIVELIEDGENGFLVEPQNTHQLYEKILLLLQDDSLRKQQSVAAKKHALQNWNAELLVERTVNVYQESIRQKRLASSSSTRSSAPGVPDKRFLEALKHKYQHHLKAGTLRVPPVSTLEGTVRRKGQTAIPDATLHLLDLTGVVLRSMTSNEFGRFTFENVQPGNYALTCSSQSCTVTKRVQVASTEPPVIDFEL